MIHSSYGNLEIVGIRDGELRYHWQAGAGGAWSADFRIGTRFFSGRPALIQGSFGTTGNFELVAPLFNGGLAHCWRNNDAANTPWSDSLVFGQAVNGVQELFNDVSLLQSASGRLEVVAATSVAALARFRIGTPPEGPLKVVHPSGGWDD
jgi:hypothetical protein